MYFLTVSKVKVNCTDEDSLLSQSCKQTLFAVSSVEVTAYFSLA